MLHEGESFTHRFDCNTVGSVPAASGYGSKTLTHFAAYVLDSSKDHASALSSLHEKIHTQSGDNNLWELLETQVGYPRSPLFTGSTVSVMPEHKHSVIKTTCFTGNNLQLGKEGVLQRQNPFQGVGKILPFTISNPRKRNKLTL